MSHQRGFVGSWRVTSFAAGDPPLLSLGIFGVDGTLTVVVPPAMQWPDGSGEVFFASAGSGAWEATGPDTAVLTFVFLTADGQGIPRGTITIRAEVRLGPDGQTFGGANTVTIADPAGNELGTIPETLQATRIAAEAPRMSTTGTPAAARSVA